MSPAELQQLDALVIRWQHEASKAAHLAAQASVDLLDAAAAKYAAKSVAYDTCADELRALCIDLQSYVLTGASNTTG